MFDIFERNFLEDKKINSDSYRTSLHLLAIILITFLVFFNIFKNDFVFDDKSTILNWRETKKLQNIPLFFKGATPVGHEGVYRPLRGVLYALDYRIFGINPTGYHAQAIIIHLATVILIYYITYYISGRKSISFITSLLFGIHPIHTEAVTWMTASIDTFGVFFFFLSCYLYLKFISQTHKKIYYLFSIISAFVAFFTYEMTLTLPFLIIFYNICFKKIQKLNLRKAFEYAGFFIPLIFYLYIRFVVFHITSRGKYIDGDFYITMLIMTKAYIKYIALHIFPFDLSINPVVWGGIQSWNTYPKLDLIRKQTILNTEVLISILILVSILVIFIKFFKKHPIVSFSIGWFFIGFLPVSYLLPQGFLLQERYAYISSFGFLLLFSFIFYNAYNAKYSMRIKNYIKNFLVLFLLVICMLFSLSTILRNKDWKDDLSFWLKLSKQSEGNVLGHFYTGDIHFNKGNFSDAIYEYKEGLKTEPDSIEAIYSLGLAYAENEELDLAEKNYNQAFKIDPKYYNFARLRLEKKYNIKETGLKSKNSNEEKDIGYKSEIDFFYSYPKELNAYENKKTVYIKDPNGKFNIEIEKHERDDNVLDKTKQYGILEKEGEALIPNTDKSYVRFWRDKEKITVQFFLFFEDSVVEVKAWPFDNSIQKKLDEILISIRMKREN